MSYQIKDTLEEFANHLCKGSLNVNVGNLYTVYFTQLKDGRILVNCNLWRKDITVLASFDSVNGFNIVEAYKLYCQIFDISLNEK